MNCLISMDQFFSSCNFGHPKRHFCCCIPFSMFLEVLLITSVTCASSLQLFGRIYYYNLLFFVAPVCTSSLIYTRCCIVLELRVSNSSWFVMCSSHEFLLECRFGDKVYLIFIEDNFVSLLVPIIMYESNQYFASKFILGVLY